MRNLIKSSFFWIILIFLSAAVFRLSSLDLMEFKLDEARDVYEMERFINKPYLFQRGTIQSTGVYNPPLWYYILGVFALPSQDPEYLTFMIALLNCLAIAGLYWVVRKFYGQMVGVAVGLLMAFSPWAILYSRKIWAPDFILILLVPFLYFLHRLILKKKAKAILGVVLFGSLLAQLHASGIFLAVATGVALVVLHLGGVLANRSATIRGVNWKYALLGLVLSLIPLTPYLLYQIQNGCPDCVAFSSYQEEVSQFDPLVLLRPFQFVNGSSIEITLGEDYQLFGDSYFWIRPMGMVFILEFVLGIMGVIYIIKKEKKYLFLLPIIGIVPMLYLISQTPAHLYYFLILSPIMMLFYALGLKWFKPMLGISIITVIIIINIIFTLTLYQFLHLKQTINGDYGPIYRLSKQQAEEALVNFKDSADYELIRSEYWVQMFNTH